MGPSGCGKSTLLNLLGALDQPTEGEIWVACGHLNRARDRKDVDEFRAHSTVGFVFQLHNLLPTLTAQENVEVPMQGPPVGAARTQGSERSRYLLDLSRAERPCRTTCPTSFRVGSDNASRLPGPWPTAGS